MLSISRNVQIITTLLLFLIITVSSTPTSLKEIEYFPETELFVSRVFLGYNGFNGTPRKPQASKSGELGAVFYIADSVDLAKSFAVGPPEAASKNYVCLIYADADAWAMQPKVWVSAEIRARGPRAVNSAFPGAVLFAPHGSGGLPPKAPKYVYQMGIRAAQLERLGVTSECHPKSWFSDEDHSSLKYPAMTKSWAIQIPKPRPRLLQDVEDVVFEESVSEELGI